MDARKVVAALVLALLPGCGAMRGVTTVRVPYAIPCQQVMPERPVMPLDLLQLGVKIDAWIAAAQSEISVREAYELELSARLAACVTTLPK
jgi:hypothetical protein